MHLNETARTIEVFRERHGAEYCILAVCISLDGEVEQYYLSQNHMHDLALHIVSSFVFVNSWTVSFHDIKN